MILVASFSRVAFGLRRRQRSYSKYGSAKPQGEAYLSNLFMLPPFRNFSGTTAQTEFRKFTHKARVREPNSLKPRQNFLSHAVNHSHDELLQNGTT